MAMVGVLLVMHLSALTTFVGAVASPGLLVAGLNVAHCEEQVSHRHEIKLLKCAIRVFQVDVINVCISLVVQILINSVSAFLQVDFHDFKKLSIVVCDGSCSY